MINTYQLYQNYADATDPLRACARLMAPLLGTTWPGVPVNPYLRKMASACEVFARTQLTHVRPPFGLGEMVDGERTITVHEEEISGTPFCGLLHFRKENAVNQPKVLVVAPMSGHFATLLRGTVKTLLRDHDVYITDWRNARDIALEHGRFGLDEYVSHVIDFLDVLGPGTHLLAVCQPTVAALTAAAVMAEADHPAQPRTMTLMAGPLDTRVNPTAVNALAKSKPMAWFEKNMISTVPARHVGGGRRVYPGFVQLSAFMNMNLNRHIEAFRKLYHHLVEGEEAQAAQIKDFYEEYFAMSDLPAEFYLETVRLVFQEHALPLGKLSYGPHLVNPRAIRRTALFTIEGEKDDICAVGQTVAAQEMCSNIRPYMRMHHVQTAVGHYGVFNGRRWENEIYPRLRDFINMHHR
ncbi:polyhydroxyalkanoate depolymerase [Herbaspirillum rubrisubalbicans Os34]|uniref:Polyhydroxyalkanoate depolymerase n=1 Tax=Herbaspirillum rubrisubalbicans Os34 TaxID=1235827 RepID=A0A6M3ZKY7_9BURK|nr:polyhydroxyalkanoate depolymerase [Herbaspirillum rubrisubalbicans]QJP99294.1 polyhydroxyalkanoate depolymerase [Herbaspirillum rubrisubalbicans Os34]